MSNGDNVFQNIKYTLFYKVCKVKEKYAVGVHCEPLGGQFLRVYINCTFYDQIQTSKIHILA